MLENLHYTNTQILRDMSPAQRQAFSLFYFSFQYSQGDLTLQADIFRWLRMSNQINKSLLTPSFLKSIMTINPPKGHTGGYNRNTNRIYRALTHTWEELTAVLGEPVPQKDRVLTNCLKGILERDSYYQDKITPRAGRLITSNYLPDCDDDPHASHLRRYAVLKQKTKHPVFDQFYSEIGDFLDQAICETGRGTLIGYRFFNLIELWEKNHPGHKFRG